MVKLETGTVIRKSFSSRVFTLFCDMHTCIKFNFSSLVDHFICQLTLLRKEAQNDTVCCSGVKCEDITGSCVWEKGVVELKK